MTQDPMNKNNPNATKTMTFVGSVVPTPAERSLGRFMRAPDHDAGTASPDAAGGSGAGNGAGAGETVTEAAAPVEAGTDGGKVEAAAPAAAAAEQVTKTADEAKEGADKPKEGEASADEGSIAGGAGAKEGEGKVEVLGAPEAYDVKVPEALAKDGMAFDKEVFDLVEPELRALDLSNAAAQQLVSAYAEKVVPALVARGQKQGEEAQLARAAEVRKEWAEAARSDQEIGGVNFDKTVDACAQVWDRYGIKKDTGFRQLLDESGLGNHPEMLRFLSRVATTTGEGQFVSPEGAGADARPVWDRVYGQPVQDSGGR